MRCLIALDYDLVFYQIGLHTQHCGAPQNLFQKNDLARFRLRLSYSGTCVLESWLSFSSGDWFCVLRVRLRLVIFVS
tara:strand:- start:167 stop:397 length:231 start_codon:yes stop_codon:yes gene_type:complete